MTWRQEFGLQPLPELGDDFCVDGIYTSVFAILLFSKVVDMYNALFFIACFNENIFYFCFDCILLLLLLCSFLKLLLALWSPMLSGARTLATKEGKWASGNFWAILAIQPRIWLLPRRPTS